MTEKEVSNAKVLARKYYSDMDKLSQEIITEVADWIRKQPYTYYANDSPLPDINKGLNCEDERITRMRRLSNEIAGKSKWICINDRDCIENIRGTIHDLHVLIKKELVDEYNMKPLQATMFINRHFDFNHMEVFEYEGRTYLQVKPAMKMGDDVLVWQNRR